MDEQPAKSSHDGVSQGEDKTEYPPFKKVLPTVIATWLVFFVVAIDRTIIGTAIPTISREFQSFGSIAWYEAGFLLPNCALQLTYGRIYKYYSTKWVLIIHTAIFEIGSIVCATAPSSNALIVGRVITGIGGVGIGPGCFLLIKALVPNDQIPKYTGALGSVFGISSIVGPVLGGYLTSVTWRWCFWINLPIGGVAGVMLLILTPKTPPPAKGANTLKGRFWDLDPLGFMTITPSLICLLLAVEFGGSTYPWNSGTIIALFVLFGVFLIAFIAGQIWRGEEGTVPPHIIKQRTVLWGCVGATGIGSALIIYSFYLPIWFQVIQGKTPQKSGLSLIPELLSTVVAVIANGIFVTAIGYYNPTFILGACVLMVGGGLISTWTVNIGAGRWIGYQIVTGFGLGLALQTPIIATQNVLSLSDAPAGISLLNLFISLGGTVFITVAQTLLESSLAKNLKPILPNIDPKTLAGQGAATLRNTLSGDLLHQVLVIYNAAMRGVWYLALGLSSLVLIGALGVEWRSVKESKKKSKDEEKVAEQVEATVSDAERGEDEAAHADGKDVRRGFSQTKNDSAERREVEETKS